MKAIKNGMKYAGKNSSITIPNGVKKNQGNIPLSTGQRTVSIKPAKKKDKGMGLFNEIRLVGSIVPLPEVTAIAAP